MKTIQLIALSFLLASCQGTTFDIFGTKVSLVDDRVPDGTFKPVSEIHSPVDGQEVDGSARLFRFKGGDIGVTKWNSGVMAGAIPNIRK